MLIFQMVLLIVGLVFFFYGRYLLSDKYCHNPGDAPAGIIIGGLGVIILLIDLIMYLVQHIHVTWIN